MKVFVDVGAHEGQTLKEVTKKKWPFDVIYAIEPMPRELEVLERKYARNARVVIIPLALVNYTGRHTMYGNNDLLEASIYSTKNDVDTSFETEVPCLDASIFFSMLPAGQIFVNMNCEGAEIPILDSLIDSGQIHCITHMLLSFDIEKVEGMEGEEIRMRDKLSGVGFDRYTTDYGRSPIHVRQIAQWLRGIGVQ